MNSFAEQDEAMLGFHALPVPAVEPENIAICWPLPFLYISFHVVPFPVFIFIIIVIILFKIQSLSII